MSPTGLGLIYEYYQHKVTIKQQISRLMHVREAGDIQPSMPSKSHAIALTIFEAIHTKTGNADNDGKIVKTLDLLSRRVCYQQPSNVTCYIIFLIFEGTVRIQSFNDHAPILEKLVLFPQLGSISHSFNDFFSPCDERLLCSTSNHSVVTVRT